VAVCASESVVEGLSNSNSDAVVGWGYTLFGLSLTHINSNNNNNNTNHRQSFAEEMIAVVVSDSCETDTVDRTTTRMTK